MNETNSTSATWEIAKFKNVTIYKDSYLKSTIVSRNNDVFYLGFESKDKIAHQKNRVAIYLFRYIESESITDVSVLWKVALINKNGYKCFTKDIETSFIAKNLGQPVSGGLYHLHRDFILDPSNRLLPGGKLVIKWQVTFLKNSKLVISNQKLQIANMKALEDYESLLESSKHSDVVFVIGGINSKVKQFKLHKNILSARSPVFGAMFDSDLEESKKNRVEITDVEVQVFEELLRFIYGGKVEAMEQYAEDLLVLSDKYQLESLKHLCEQSLSNNLTVETVAHVITLADIHHAGRLKSNCIQFITSNATQVTATEGWKLLAKDLLMELYRDMMVKFSKK